METIHIHISKEDINKMLCRTRQNCLKPERLKIHKNKKAYDRKDKKKSFSEY